MRHKLRLGLTAAVAAVALAIGGCATGPSDAPTEPGGGEITVGTGYGISQLNPALLTVAFEATLYPLIWNGLTKQLEDGSIVGDLATEWSSNDELTEWTFSLASGVKFHDGTELTAADVVESFEYHLDPDTAAKYLSKIKLIESVSAPDESTVVFQLSQPLAVLPLAIVDIKVIDVENLETINTAPNGTGPYQLADFVPDDRVVLEPFEDYFGEAAKLSQITIVKAADNTAATTALRAGDLDVLYELSYADAGSIGADSAFSIVTAEPYHWAQTWKLDTSTAPFDNVLARQALSYATDRESILEKAYYGFGEAATTNTSVAASSPFFARGGLVDYTYDLDKAADLFAQAGVMPGDSITWWGPAGIQPEKVIAAEILRDSLSQIGIELVIDNRPVAEWTPAFIPVGQEFPGYIVPTGATAPNDPAYMFQFARTGSCECNWNSPQFESAYDAALAVGDDAERTEAFHELQQIVSTEVPVVIPLVTSFLSATTSKLKGVWSNTSGTQLHLENAYLEG